MKILFITAGMTGGGTERVIAVLSNYFAAAGHEVSILMTAHGRDEVDYELNDRVELETLGGQTGGSNGKRLERIRKIRQIYRKAPDQHVISFGTETNLYAILAARGLPIHLIICERNDPNQCGYRLLRNLIYRLTGQFVFQTADARDCFSPRIQKRSTVIANPVKEGLPEPYAGKRRHVVTAVGRLNEQKNHRLLLESFTDFRESFPDYRLVIYGQGELLEELTGYAQELGIGDAVTFAGFFRDVLEKIRDCGMYVLSSDYEGISNSLLEAMAVGLPVIATDCPAGGSRMAIESGKNGILIPLQDRKALSEAMKLLAGNEAYAEGLAAEAVKIKERYSTEAICREWEEVLKLADTEGLNKNVYSAGWR